MKKNGIRLRDINTTNIKEVRHFSKDKNEILSRLEVLNSQQKQALVARMISNEKTITSLVKNKFQNHGQLQFKSDLSCILSPPERSEFHNNCLLETQKNHY